MSANQRMRVVVVDDSSVFRALIKKAFEKVPFAEVVGEAKDGAQAIDVIQWLKPDLVTLDVEMPNLCGLGVLRAVDASGDGARFIMISSLTKAGTETTVKALLAGASDFLVKPVVDSPGEALDYLIAHLSRKVSGLREASRGAGQGVNGPATKSLPSCLPPPPVHSTIEPGGVLPRVLGIGISTGGPKALSLLLSRLPRAFPIPVVIVQHMPAGFTKSLAQGLEKECELQVFEAEDGRRVGPGMVAIAQGGKHLRVERGRGDTVFLRVSEEEPELACRPSANVMFRSIASEFRERSMVLVMTGIGTDGLAGSRSVVDSGGIVWAQDEPSSTVYGMPRAVVENGLAQVVHGLAEMPDALIALARKAA